MDFFSAYCRDLARINGLDPQVHWLFYPGMLQDSKAMWWADFKQRTTAHEGMDFCFYRQDKGPVKHLVPGAKVPAAAKGTILSITRDLLGKSIAVTLAGEAANACQPTLVYAHLDPAPDLAPGDEIKKGQKIGTTFDTRTIGSRLMSHLHLSCICLPRPLEQERLDWDLFCDRSQVTYINPVFL